MTIGNEGRPSERLRLASNEPPNSPRRLKRLAQELRECAKKASWPDIATKLMDAAESLEVQAVEFEAGFSQRA